MAECTFCKMQYVRQTKIIFLPDEVTTDHSRNKFNVENDNDLLKHFHKFHFDVLNAKPDITECFMVIFVEQPDKTLL